MTDYTDLSSVKLALGSAQTTDDALLASLITQASRAIDRYCAGHLNSDDYFVRAAVTDAVLTGIVAHDGWLYCWPRKPIVESVTALAYRDFGDKTWQDVDIAKWVTVEGYTVKTGGFLTPRRVQVKISFTGGFNPLPDDLVNAATLLSVRFYREVKSGLGDSIGVAELGTLTYTKALPARVIEMLKPYKRVVV
ncbi:MAG: phage head-tail connector protein [Anaerolineales bacterium]